MKGPRGVILLHVILVLALLALISSMVLKATLSRQVVAAKSIEADEIRAALAGASARITSCLATIEFPPPSAGCVGADTNGTVTACIGTQAIADRSFSFRTCDPPGNANTAQPTCRIEIKVCDRGVAPCAAPGC